MFGAVLLAYLLWLAYMVWPYEPLDSFLGPVARWLDGFHWRDALAAFGLSATTVVAAAYFILWRYLRARRYYLRKAKSRPEELVKPGSIFGRVVGRDQLCDALINDLRNPRRRRPHVVVGAIGVGKTALLVRLTERLARKGIAPVVLQLRDAEEGNLHFTELARTRFLDEMQERVYSRAEAEKVWQRLRYTADRVVVLADGLDELLKGKNDRDNKIRKAIAEAQEEQLPLIITSRPQNSLQAINVVQTDLEPLSEEAALSYVAEGGTWRSNKARMDWVVEAAEVAESPLYLILARDLEGCGLLERIVGGGEDEFSDPRDQDVWVLRYDLLDTWVDALRDGHLYPEQPISRRGREATIEYLSALACAALRTNSTRALYEDLAEKAEADAHDENLVTAAIREQLRHRTADDARGKSLIDVRLAGSWGSRLGLVEEEGTGVRFQHSVLQAYLASRYIGALIDPAPHGEGKATAKNGRVAAFFNKAQERPGRELAMALIFYSRSVEALSACHWHRDEGACPIDIVRGQLRDLADDSLKNLFGEGENGGEAPAGDAAVDAQRGDEQDLRIRALEMYSAALDVDSFHHCPDHREIVATLRGHWEWRLREYNDNKLEPAKKAVVKRIGAAGRLLSRRQAAPPYELGSVGGQTAYDLLFQIACMEPSHSVRFTIAQEIGEGGDVAFIQVSDALRAEESDDGNAISAGLAIARRITGDTSLTAYSGFYETESEPASRTAQDEALADDLPAAPSATRTERLLRKRRAQLVIKNQRKEQEAETVERIQLEKGQHEKIMKAWLAPMLVYSCSSTQHRGTPYERLAKQISRVRDGNADLAVQIALAQGFRLAANHRVPQTASGTARDFLNEQAWEMLKHTSYWFARLALLHALTLWALPDDVQQSLPRYGHGANPGKQVKRWLEQADHAGPGRRREHPLVRAAGQMARQALQTRRPDRFLWIDEAEMVSQIGSETSSLREPRLHNLWIPPSRGWSTLDPGAQQLLADVLVLLTLTDERGDRPEESELRLKRVDRDEPPLLPPCLAEDRRPLDAKRALVSDAPRSLPGSNCTDGCPFELCPYPPKGPQCRTEMSELFCIQQRSMLNTLQLQAWRFLRFRRRTAWQRSVSVANLRSFWDEMGARARNYSLKESR